jgi:hypothetical protein
VVYLFCRQSPHAAVLMPSHGKYVGATSRPLNDCSGSSGERRAQLAHPPRQQALDAHLLFDANAWKTFMFSRLRWAWAAAGAGRCGGRSPRITGCSPIT